MHSVVDKTETTLALRARRKRQLLEAASKTLLVDQVSDQARLTSRLTGPIDKKRLQKL